MRFARFVSPISDKAEIGRVPPLQLAKDAVDLVILRGRLRAQSYLIPGSPKPRLRRPALCRYGVELALAEVLVTR